MNEELLNSFVRVGISSDDADQEPRSVYAVPRSATAKKASEGNIEPPKQTFLMRRNKNPIIIEMKKPRKAKESCFDEVYTDKDRAAAVSFGYADIKLSLNNKQRSERSDNFKIPEEADAATLLMLGTKEIKNGNLENGIQFLNKVIEMNPHEITALISRSKCFMKTGEPEKALKDAEAALRIDNNNIRAIYQKAEALYFLGNFEHSLMYFHRGLKLRPELSCLRLGVQKTQEAIENTIGSVQKAEPCLSPVFSESSKTSSTSSLKDKKQSKKLLGELFVDKEYLENLLKHPDLKRADTKTENVSSLAKDAISFLNNRQEFWRQQKPADAANPNLLN